MSNIITKDDILKLKGEKTKIVEVEAFGGIMYVKRLTARERDAFEGSLVVTRPSKMGPKRTVSTDNIRAKLFVRCVVAGPDDDTRVFADAEAELVGSLPADEVDKVYTVAQDINGFSQKDVEELAGNLDSDHSEE